LECFGLRPRNDVSRAKDYLKEGDIRDIGDFRVRAWSEKIFARYNTPRKGKMGKKFVERGYFAENAKKIGFLLDFQNLSHIFADGLRHKA
jgi:hypothetical protein